MPRSKSRSGSIDIGQKNHYSSVFSRTLSASKLCRGGDLVSQIDSSALKKSSKNRSNRDLLMDKEKGELETELHRTREQLGITEVERDHALDELREAKEEAYEASLMVSEAKKVDELTMELKSLKEMLTNSQEELKVKDDKIKSLDLELGKSKQLELVLLERDESLHELEDELRRVRESNIQATELLSESEKRIQVLEEEVRRSSMEITTKQLEQTRIELEESYLQINALRDKIVLLQESSKQNSRDFDSGDFRNDENEGLKGELQLTKENLARAEENERGASLKIKSLLEEMELLKNEMKLATEGEEKSAKAMEDLAMALKEVTTEANQTKEKLAISLLELEQVKGEAEKLKEMVRSSDERHQKLLDEAKQAAELHKNTADRLRMEAEESILASNGKEMGFVTCIKRAEEEAAVARNESARLAESLKAAEDMARAAKEETNKLRDILKQAISEANVAKAAADIARDENSKLKDSLSERDEALNFLTREYKALRKNLKIEDNEHLGFNIDDLKFTNERENSEKKQSDEDPDKVETPRSSVSTHRRGYSSAFSDNTGTPNSEDFDNLDRTRDGSDGDRNSHRRRKTMFSRVGDLLMIGRSFHRKEAATESDK